MILLLCFYEYLKESKLSKLNSRYSLYKIVRKLVILDAAA